MPIDMPPERTGNLKQDFDELWEWAWRLAEALRLREEGQKRGVSQT